MNRNLPRAVVCACVIALASYSANAAQAEPRSETVSIRVSSEGLDLTRAAGADEFLARLSRAATQACKGEPDFSPVMAGGGGRLRRCRAHALAGAVAQSRWPLVHREFAARPEARMVRLAER